MKLNSMNFIIFYEPFFEWFTLPILMGLFESYFISLDDKE